MNPGSILPAPKIERPGTEPAPAVGVKQPGETIAIKKSTTIPKNSSWDTFVKIEIPWIL